MNRDSYKKSWFYLLVSIVCFILALIFEDNLEYTSNFLKILSVGMAFVALYYDLDIEK